MNPTKAIFAGVILPGLFSFAVFAIAWKNSRRREDTQFHIWPGSLALGAGFCGAFFLLHGLPDLPPTEAFMWIPLIVAVTTIFGLIDGIFKLPYALVWFLRIVVSLGFIWQILDPLVRNSWTTGESNRWVGWISISIVAIWGFLDEAAWRVRGAGLPIALTLAALALSLGLLWGKSAELFHIGLILAAATAGAILPGLKRPVLSLASGAIPVYVMTYYSLLVCGYFFVELPLAAAIAFAVAPLGPVCAMASSLSKQPRLQTIVAVVFTLVPGLVGLYFASDPGFTASVISRVSHAL